MGFSHLSLYIYVYNQIKAHIYLILYPTITHSCLVLSFSLSLLHPKFDPKLDRKHMVTYLDRFYIDPKFDRWFGLSDYLVVSVANF